MSEPGTTLDSVGVNPCAGATIALLDELGVGILPVELKLTRIMQCPFDRKQNWFAWGSLEVLNALKTGLHGVVEFEEWRVALK